MKIILNKTIFYSLFLTALLMASSPLLAASWPTGGGGANDETSIAIVTASSGNTYALGQFQGTAYFGDFELNSVGANDIYVLKISPSGEILWAVQAGGTLNDIPTTIDVDESDNVYIGGSFLGTIRFGSLGETALETVPNGFVAKLNSAGVWRWSKIIGTSGKLSGVDVIKSIEGDFGTIPPNEGSIFVSGFYHEQAQIGDGSGPDLLNGGLSTEGASELFVVRIEHDGGISWARDRGGNSSRFDTTTAMEVDETGGIYIFGEKGGSSVLYSEDFNDANDQPLPANWSVVTTIHYTPALGVSDNFDNSPNNTSPNLYFSGNTSTEIVEICYPDPVFPGFFPDICYFTVKVVSHPVGVTSPKIPALGVTKLNISFDVYEGDLDNPEVGENFYVYFVDVNGNYQHLKTYNGGGGRTNGTTHIEITDSRAFHNNLKLLFYTNASNALAQDFWHVDNINVIADSAAEKFVFDISNTTSNNPTFGTAKSIPFDLNINDVVVDEVHNKLVISGDSLSDNTGFCPATLDSGAFVASLSLPSFTCEWIRTPITSIESSGQGVTVDNLGNIYQIGTFTGSLEYPIVQEQCQASNTPGPEIINSHGDSDDVFIASYNYQGNVCWLTGGDFYDDIDKYPAIIGDIQNETGIDISTNGLSNIYFTGEMQDSIVFGAGDRFDGLGGTDIYVHTWGTNGKPLQVESLPVGVDLTPPSGAYIKDFALQPEFFQNGIKIEALAMKLLYWAPPLVANGDARLIPLQPFAELEVHWRINDIGENEDRIITTVQANWPSDVCDSLNIVDCYQVHASGAPVEIEPASGDYLVLDLPFASGNAAINNRVFNNSLSGFSTIVYINGPSPNINQFPIEVQVIRSIPFESVPLFRDNVSWIIGTKVEDSYHNEIGRTGYVLNELAYYDGTGSNAAYNREARTGQIIPVNRIETSRPQDSGRELSVAWYNNDFRGVYWPDKAVRYDTVWPFDPDKIIIASQLGGEVLGQNPLDSLSFPSLSLYIQSDPNSPGFNPNDEHAIFMPSNTGTGIEAIFALRSDFGSKLDGDISASSDPYVLVKYYDENVFEWKMRIYEVIATGAGYNSFQFSGVAATTVSPPYPVRLLPGCIESKAVGQAEGEQPPPPFFQDYKAQIWAKSAGSGELMYYYPLQPGFFYDLDTNDIQDDINNDGQPDFDTTCVPWLARLAVDEGGTPNPTDPIKIGYDITWPTNVPQLTTGETLLEPKNGLPDIINQAAIEVVYDGLFNSKPDPLPTDTLAQMIDPISQRFVKLEAVPSSIATELETTGKQTILGSADGTIKLPAAILKRMSFDPLNKKLILQGLYDPTILGEPLLVPNVLSKNDRVALKKLNGGNGNEESGFTGLCQVTGSCDWDQAVEALFRLSRNPSGINRICTSSAISDGRRVCFISRPVTEDDVLIGFQDTNNDYVLEPFQAVGAQAALTAGSAQSSGFMTLAFNNDASLTPLPISLNIIRVGCLQSPLPPVLPENADIYASYQGQLQVLEPENIFDEQIVLRHSGDFGGNPDVLEFEWFFHPDEDGSPPEPLPVPENGQLNGWIKYPVANPVGANEITIAGANIQTLSDNWYIARYKGLPGCDNQTKWSLWAGQPGAGPLNEQGKLAQGWVKRVLNRLNPFDNRVKDFAKAATNNFASMLIQLGERYEGDIAMNNDPDNLNSIGLIEAYTTVMRRAMSLSVDSTPPVNYDPANTAILQVASRLVDFYTLLGNEAYADAQDPMIGISTDDGLFSVAPSIFNFQNQLGSLLEEELVLLRGRDGSNGPIVNPIYNRLVWNFSTGDGEVAYALSYNISDIDDSGNINEFDARIQYPQGHGDAWGHYLTALDTYYQLLRHPFYSWNVRTEAITIAGGDFKVDFLDERQFAETAAAKARVGAEVVDLTYRSYYVEDPAGQYQGYTDPDEDRAWGVSEWGHRAGMGAYFDWATANAIIPAEDLDPDHSGIEKIERSNISELNQIVSHYNSIQSQIDEADRGLNPLGLASGVVPFDIDPVLVVGESNNNGATHFEQIYKRAEVAMDNVISVWDYANQVNKLMRRNQDTIEDIAIDSRGAENDYENQLIEIFGTPYDDDIGVGGTYPDNYSGPDLYHYMYIDTPALAGTDFDFSCKATDSSGNCTDGYDADNNTVAVIKAFTGTFAPVENGINFFDISPGPPGTLLGGITGNADCQADPLVDGCALGTLTSETLEVEYQTVETADLGFAFTKPGAWTGNRRAEGQLQDVLYEMVLARIEVRQAILDYDLLKQRINTAIDTLRATFQIAESNIDISNSANNEIYALTAVSLGLNTAAAIGHRVALGLDATFETTAECIPKNLIVGLANGGDVTSGPRCAIQAAGSVSAFVVDTVADGLEAVASITDYAAERVGIAAEREVDFNNTALDLFDVKGEIDLLMQEEPALRAEIYIRAESAQQLIGKYNTTLANGLEVMEQLVTFRRQGSAEIQEYRYEDMAYRIFRNDALQKYRAAFEQAARYVYLAAAAYDYETNLLGTDQQSGQSFLTDIVKERSIGQILNGSPVPGSHGLADPMARMKQSFDVLKTQMGFNNPDVETNRFSLRYELFRIADDVDSNDTWREQLKSKTVENIWDIPEFKRYARPFAPESAGPQPAIVLTFDTSVLFGLNFFGNKLGPSDSAYDSSQFSTRIRGVGTWFEDYASLPLSNTPRMYLFPVGADMMRSPGANNFNVRQWQVTDQKLPIPISLGATDLDRFDWLPTVDAQIGNSTDIRKHSQYLAHHFSEPFDVSEIISSSRLIGRSVWNRKWMMIIPGASFLNDPNEGLDTFIEGELIPGGNGERDGNGVSDIHLFFTTYSYSGN